MRRKEATSTSSGEREGSNESPIGKEERRKKEADRDPQLKKHNGEEIVYS